MFTMAKAKFGEGERTVEVLVVGNTAYVDDDFCAKAFPGDHVQVVAANEARRDGSSLHASWKELLQHLDQAYEFDRVVYLSTYLTPHTEAVGDIELLRSVFRACMGRQIQLLFVTGPMGADGAVDVAGQNGKGIIARAANDLCRYYAVRDGIQAKILRVPYLYTASPTLEDPILTPLFEACSQGSAVMRAGADSPLGAAVPVYRVCRDGGPVFGAAVRCVLDRLGCSAARAGCGVSPAVHRGARGASTPYLRQLGRLL